MILVVTEELNLAFLLQHQGRFVSAVRTASEAIQQLKEHGDNIKGVILDDRVRNSRVVSGYITNKRPDLKVTAWNVAQRNSPFKNVAAPMPKSPPQRSDRLKADDRFIWYGRGGDEPPR